MLPSERLALATAWACKVLNTDPRGDGGVRIQRPGLVNWITSYPVSWITSYQFSWITGKPVGQLA